jgi:hypothetical protein
MTNYATELSNDRKTLRIRYTDGRTVTLQSERPEGFTNAQALRAGEGFEAANTLTVGQVNRTRLVHIRGYSVLLKVNTGPPTWWIPRIELRKDKAMVGWFRALIAASWKRES